MAFKIEYKDKVALQNNEAVPNENKVTAEDLNEIKEVVNANADELELKQGKEEGKGLSTNDFADEFKEKLEGLNNYDDTQIKQKITDIENKNIEQDEKITENTNNISEIKQKNTEQDTIIEALQKENTELKVENERLNNDINAILVTEKAEGENITLNDTAEARFKSFGISGNSWQETRKGYNLLNLTDVSNKTVVSLSNNEITLTWESGFDCFLVSNENQNISLDANKTYTVSFEHKGSKINLGNYQDATNKVTTGNTSSYTRYSFSFTSLETLRLDITRNDLTGSCNIKNIMIYEGTDIKEYEPYGAMPSPKFKSDIQNVTGNANVKITNGLEDTDINYQEQTFTFLLAEGQRLMKGDYLADDGIHHKRKQKILDGTESYFVSTLNEYQWFGLNVAGLKPSTLLCNCLKNYKMIGNYAGISSNNASNRIYLSISKDITTIDKLKTYLAEQYANGTPVVFEYDLAEEEIEPYTEEQQAVYDEIKKTAHSYKNITHIFSTDEIGPIFDVTYFKDLETILNNMQAQILAE